MLSKADIKLIRSLADKQARMETGLFVAEGEKMAGEAVASGWHVERILVAGKYQEHTLGQETPGNISGRGISFDAAERISAKEMERVSRLKTPPPVLAVVRIPVHRAVTADDAREGLVLALDDIQDPGNVGTMIRIADWFGIKDMVCSPATADCFNPKVVQATMGALFRVRVHYTGLAGFLGKASAAGAKVYGTFLEGENIYEAPLSPSGVIVMGNEGKGISDAVASCVTHKLLIPPYPADRRGPESLNVAAATAVVCSEFRRR